MHRFQFISDILKVGTVCIIPLLIYSKKDWFLKRSLRSPQTLLSPSVRKLFTCEVSEKEFCRWDECYKFGMDPLYFPYKQCRWILVLSGEQNSMQICSKLCFCSKVNQKSNVCIENVAPVPLCPLSSPLTVHILRQSDFCLQQKRLNTSHTHGSIRAPYCIHRLILAFPLEDRVPTPANC